MAGKSLSTMAHLTRQLQKRSRANRSSRLRKAVDLEMEGHRRTTPIVNSSKGGAEGAHSIGGSP